MALGLRLGADVERWATAASIACYVAALGVLAWNSWTLRRESRGLATWIPIAAVLGALHPDWQIFATGGLETSLFALEITAVYVLLARSEPGRGRAAATGLLLALASMTRPDGLILAATVALFTLLTDPRRPRTLLALGAAFLIVWAPYTVWRVSYYGDFFPNTYYAKSAAVAWYSQGATYISLYSKRYWPLLLGPALVALAWIRTARECDPVDRVALDPWRRSVVLAAMLALVYIAFVVRVGGDFMFGRFLIPVTPLLLVLLELGITRAAVARVRTQWLLAGVVAAGIVVTPYPLPRDPFGAVSGIVCERNFYTREATEVTRNQGLALRPFLGAFLNFGGVFRGNLAAVSVSTGALTSWNPNANQQVNAIAAVGSNVYIGGNFTLVNGSTSRFFLAAVDASTGTLTAWNPSSGSSVFSLAARGNVVYAGGGFNYISRLPHAYVAGIADDVVTGVEVEPRAAETAPASVRVDAIYPNPITVAGSGIVRFSLRGPRRVTVRLYDVQGREVATLLRDEPRPAGRHEIGIPSALVPSGVYFIEVVTGEGRAVGRAVLTR